MNLDNPYIKALAAGLAAALATAAVVVADGRISAVEAIAIALSFLSGAGLTQAVQNGRELRYVRERATRLETHLLDAENVIPQIYGAELNSYGDRLNKLEAKTGRQANLDKLAADTSDMLSVELAKKVSRIEGRLEDLRDVAKRCVDALDDRVKALELIDPVQVVEAELAAAVAAGLLPINERLDKLEHPDE
jgi:hypothetical protein